MSQRAKASVSLVWTGWTLCLRRGRAERLGRRRALVVESGARDRFCLC